MVTASFCCGLFANMQSAQPLDFENLPLDLPTHISHQNGATYHRTILHNLRHYSCERVSITKLTEIATYCTSVCAVGLGGRALLWRKKLSSSTTRRWAARAIAFRTTNCCQANKLGSYHVKNGTPQLILTSVSNKVYPEMRFNIEITFL